MIYLDYAANCPVNKDVLDKFYNDTLKYYVNPNSNHKLGLECKNMINNTTSKIKDLLKLNDYEVIYTSGASESNNLVIKGITSANNIEHIIISPFEHSSIIAPAQFLQNNGIKVDMVNLKSDGTIDLNHLESLIDNKNTLVSITSVESETGIIEPINQISELLEKYDNVIFHTDATQAIGKVNMDLNKINLVTFTPHKFYGINGVGILLKKKNIKLIPIIHGGKSTTKYRSGTPNTAIILSVYNALELAIKNMNDNNKYLINLKSKLIDSLKTYNKVVFNSTSNSINSTLNISIKGIKSDIFSGELEKNDIYVSTKSACSSDNAISRVVYSLTGDKELSSSTIRISLSTFTTMDEIDEFLKVFNLIYNRLEK